MMPVIRKYFRDEIKKIRYQLAAQKRNFGAYNDDSGLRYQPPYFYLKLKDYKRGLSYMEWFDKNFPEDPYLPEFLFEWTILLFRNGKIKEAEKKAAQTFLLNADVFDKFFGKQRLAKDKSQQLPVKRNENLKRFRYSFNKREELKDFSEWLMKVEKSDVFKSYLFDDIKDEKKSSPNPNMPNSEDKKNLYKEIKRIRRKLVKMACKKNRYGIDIDKIDNEVLRYDPPCLYLSLQDYKGGLNYLRWFHKNFPKDWGSPEFMFEWAIILFKNGNKPEAAQKAVMAFCRNDFIFDKFFGRPMPIAENLEEPDVDDPQFLENFIYESKNNLELDDFSEWLLKLESSEDFETLLTNYQKSLNDE